VVEPYSTWEFIEPMTDDLDYLGIRIGWPGSTFRLELTSPSGRVIRTDTAAADVESEVTETSAAIRVEHPEAGDWRVKVEAIEVAPGGEPVVVDVNRLEATNDPPVAIAAMNASTDGVLVDKNVQFDATQSFDPDGTVQEYRWDFGDGTSATSAHAAHAYAAPGEYVAKLTVVDGEGAEDVFEFLPVVVKAAPTEGGGGGTDGGSGGGETDGGTGGGGNGNGNSDGGGGSSDSGGGGGAGAGGGSGDSTSVPIKAFASVSAPGSVLRTVLRRRGLPITIGGVREGVTVTAVLRAPGKRRKPGPVIARRTVVVRKPGTAKVMLKASAKALRRLRRGTKMTLSLSASGAGTEPTTMLRTVRLR
jgi:chitodextrinase